MSTWYGKEMLLRNLERQMQMKANDIRHAMERDNVHMESV
jgi:hypothetical protein